MMRWVRRSLAVLLQVVGLMLLAASAAMAHGGMPDTDEIGPPMALGFVLFVLSFLATLWAPPSMLGLPEEDSPPSGRMER